MSQGTTCDPASALVHLGMSRPIVGALMCVALAAGGVMTFTGEPDKFGGCGETGGDLVRVIEITPDQDLACVLPEKAPVQKEK